MYSCKKLKFSKSGVFVKDAKFNHDECRLVKLEVMFGCFF